MCGSASFNTNHDFLLKHNDIILLSSPNQAATENSNMAITWTQKGPGVFKYETKI